MWADLALSGVQSLVKTGMAYSAAKQEAASAKKWQAYRNAMTKLADANNQNTITTNERMLEDRVSIQRFDIKRSAYVTGGAAEAAAAAVNTGGRSVNMVQFDVERNASIQQGRLTQDLEAQYMQFDEERRSSAFQSALQQDYTFIPKPSLATAALGFVSDIGSSYLSLKQQEAKRI